MHPDDPLPPVELIELTEEPSEVRSEGVVESGRRPTRRVGVVAVALAAVVALGVGLFADGGDDESPTDDDPAGAPTSAVVSAEEATPGTYLTGAPAPVFGEPLDASVLLGSVELDWRLVDLSTGFARDVPVLAGVNPARLVPVRGGVIVLADDPSERPTMLRFPSDAQEDVPLGESWPALSDEISEIQDVVSAGADRLWIVYTAPPGDDVLAAFVDVEGRRSGAPLRLPVRPVAGTGSGLVYNAGGRSYVIGPDGIEDLGPGTAYAASVSAVGRVACDGTSHCVQEVVDLASGSVARGAGVSTTAASRDDVTMSLSDDGVLATILAVLPEVAPTSGTREPATNLYVSDAEGPARGVVVDSPRDGPVWLPDGRGVLMLTGQGLMRYSVVDGRLLGQHAERVRPEGATAVVVIPD